MTPESLCMGCMAERGPSPRCVHCGWEEGSPPESPLQLPPRTVLDGKYLIGRSLGQGGFGITYLAWDLNLEFKLAVKEYFPREICTRARNESTVQPLTGSDREAFRGALKSFVDEGKALARFRDHPGIVSVLGFFQENGTGYLAMGYLEGMTFKQHLAKHGEKIPFENALQILLPVMDALQEVHRAGMLHRDVSPDNIYLTRNSQVKLLDFGNARYLLGERSQSFSAILKPGYAPEEQFRRQGRQGPWTDVYALGATFYRALTGRTPPEAPDRLAHDELVPPSRLGVVIPPRAEKALLKALAVRQEDRFQSVAEFQEKVTQVPPPPPPPPPPPNGKTRKRAAVAALIVALLGLAAYWIIAHRSQTGSLTVTANVAGARILIDGRNRPDWLTPHSFPALATGPHNITATKDGYRQASQTVNVRAGASNSVELDLSAPPPQYGKLDVRSKVEGATISVDGQTRPDWLTNHTFPDLTAGPHQVTVSKDGYHSLSRSVTLEAGGADALDFDLTRFEVTNVPTRPFGQLTVKANIDGAKILINGRSQPDWLTPHTFENLHAGSYTVTALKEGYQSTGQTVTVTAGGASSSNLNLRKSSLGTPNSNPGTGTLVVTSDPAGAKIVIDGADSGALTPHTFQEPAKAHYVLLSKDGYVPAGAPFTVESGKSVTANIRLFPPTGQFTLTVLEVSQSNPKGTPITADVFIDGKPYGQSPVKTDMVAGTHSYRVIAGSRSEEGTFEVREVGISEVRIKMLSK